MAIGYDYQQILFEPPQSVHQWRQADCLSLTTTYYQDKNPFFQPTMHYLGIDGTGKTVSEFPVIYYLVGKIWNITGRQTWVYRLLVLLLFFIGLLAIFKIVERAVRHSIAGLFASLLLFSSPVMAYYAGNFLMNIPAFSFACIGLYFFFIFKEKQDQRSLMYCVLFYCLGGLLKVSSLLTFVPICLLYTADLIGIRLSRNRIFKGNLREALSLIFVFVVILLWVSFASAYNARHTGGIFLIGILPIWNLTSEEIGRTVEFVIEKFKWDYFRPFIEVFLALSVIVVDAFRHRVEKNIFFVLLLTIIGAMVFSVLFFEALRYHDYYVIDLYIMVPLLLMALFSIVKTELPRFSSSYLFAAVLIAILLHSFDFSRRRMDERYAKDHWKNDDHRELFQPFMELEPTFKKLGIEEDDRVISLSDYSINITLYFMNRKGWTKYGVGADHERIQQKIDLGARYLLLVKDRWPDKGEIEPFLKDSIGSYKNIDIYRLPQ